MSDLRTVLQDQIDGITIQVHWFAGLERALQGSTAAEAAWVPSEGVNSIWQLVNHMTFWTQYIINVITGEPNPEGHIDNAITFGSAGDPVDEAGWEAAKAKLLQVQARLKGLLAETDLSQPPAGRKTAVGKLVADINLHNAMHLGQIILMRKMRAQEWEPVKWGE
jgi:uncharacterized damage-inducible protein DinB